MVAQTRYRPPEGPTQMWFIAHTGTPGSEHVVSIDFDKCLVTLPETDTLLEPEFELLQMPTKMDYVMTTVMSKAIEAPLKEIMWLPVLAFPALSQEPVEVAPPAPPLSPVREVVETRALPAPPPSPISCRSVSPTEPEVRLRTPTPAKRRQHNLLTDGIICKWVDVHGPTWRDLARSMGGRAGGWSDDVVRNRYIRIVEELKGVPYERKKRTTQFKRPERAVEVWTEDEDRLLIGIIRDVMGYRERGGVPWKSIAKRFGGLRTQQAIRNRASRLGIRDDTQWVTESS